MNRAINWRFLRVLSLFVLLLGAGVATFVGCAQVAKEKYSGMKFESAMVPSAAWNQRGYAANDNKGPGNALQTLLPPQSLPSQDEELWIIQRASNANQPAAAANPADLPGSGSLVTEDPKSKKTVPVPLKHTDVKAALTGYIATVDVTQQFHNPFASKIEAVYVFPLPSNAAVNEFVMTVGDRKIRGIIREREEAERIYAEAKHHGHVASLLTQERPNIFTQRVANIEPGKAIDISIRYYNTLTYADGWYEFVFPMVVGPRFNPPGSTDGVGAVGIGSRGASGQSTEVQYLKNGQRSGHDIALAVDLGGGVRVESVDSRNHRIRIKRGAEGGGIARVELDPADSIPNKDFVLRYKVAGDDVKGALVSARDARGQTYFTLMLVPPADVGSLPRSPVEMFFTLDVSGSMSGKPLEQSKAAMRYALKHMEPDDTFQIVQFASAAQQMAPRPVPATRKNLETALQFLERTQANGGTMMIQGIKASLEPPIDESRRRYVAFLTDGYIGNEAEILGALRGSLGESRVFSFGVGSSPNRYLMDAMAKMGRGAVAYLGLNDSGDEVMARYFDRVRKPALTNLSIDWGGLQVTQVYPRELPDLFVGRPVILTGKFAGGDRPTTIRVTGKVGGQPRTLEIPFDPPMVKNEQAAALPAIWARQMIADLAEQSTYDPNIELPQIVKQTALEYGLMSAYTAFIAVDSLSTTSGDSGTTVAVPVPVPDGVKYETTVTDGQAQPAAEKTN